MRQSTTLRLCFKKEVIHRVVSYLLVKQKAKAICWKPVQSTMQLRLLLRRHLTQKRLKEFQTKSLRSFYNSALLRASVQPQEVKDLMMGHGRKGARGHYDYDEQTIKENYTKVFEHLSINGLQTRTDIAKLKEEFILTKSQLADMMAKQQKENERLENQLKTVTRMLGEMKPLIENIDEISEFLEKRREEKEIEKQVKQHEQ